jgi:hypothetical protein
MSCIFCKTCNAEKKDRFCEKCNKETNNLFKVEFAETLHSNISLGINQKRPGVGFIKKMFQGFRPSGDSKLPKGG